MKIILSTLLVSFGALLMAQTLEEKVRLKKSPRGEDLIELNGGLAVYTEASSTDGWYRVNRIAYLPMPMLQEGQMVAAGQILSNEEGEKIGEVLQAVKAKEVDTLKGFRSDDRVRVVLEGFLFKTELADGSILEEEMSEILTLRNRSEQQERLEVLFRKYAADEEHFEPFDAFAIRKEQASLREQDDFRMIVVFRGSSIYAVLSKDHQVEVEKTKLREEKIDGIEVLYFYKPSEAQKEVIEEIMYTYLAL